MNIVKYKKLKDGFYNIELDNKKNIIIHEDLILKHDLLLKKKLSKQELKSVLDENSIYLAYNKALRSLTTKMRCIKDIKELLSKDEVDDNIIEDVVTKLVNQGYLDDKKYCIAYINDRINLSMDGPLKIINSLKNNNIKEEYISDAIKVFTKEIEEERIKKIINKSISKNDKNGSALLKQKIQISLFNLGYSQECIYSCLNDFQYNDEEIYKKEYDKLYKKLSQKYSGNELEYRIKQKMYQKGFRQ